MSVLGEGGDPCIVGNGPSKDHTTEKKIPEMAPLSLTVAYVREPDNGGGAGHVHLPVAAGDGFPC